MNENFSTQFVKKGGKLCYLKRSHEALFKKFVDALPENTQLDVLFEAGELGRLGQLSRIHGNIGKIARETGSSFEEIKIQAKKESGLILDETVLSLGDVSKQQLDTVLETTIRLGEFAGLNLR